MREAFRSYKASLFINATFGFFFFFVLSIPAFGQFVHPGISHKQSDLKRMKLMVEPWATSFEDLSSHPRAQFDFPVDVVNQDPSYAIEFSDGSNNFMVNDGGTAYLNALMWYFRSAKRTCSPAQNCREENRGTVCRRC